jgi:uncharacterized protein YbjT (DUF2867 family)
MLEGFFLLLAAASVRDADELALPMGAGKTSPVSSVDVAAILDDPAPHIGHIYDLTGPESARPGPLRARFLRGARPDDPLSRRTNFRLERKTSGGGPVGACRPPPHSDDRTPQAGAL